jgi:hypothetical protein
VDIRRIKPPPFSRHEPKAALEFGLNEIGTTKMELKHFKKDLRRLTDSRNKVERGYLLFFVRREDYHKKSKMHPVIDRLPDVLKREVEENQEPTTNLVVLYLESPSPGSSRKEVIPKDRSAWVGF